MTRYDNWGEIPEELQKTIKEQWRTFINGKIQATKLYVELPSKIWDYIDDAKIFQWAISQGLINKLEPVEGWFVPMEKTMLFNMGSRIFYPDKVKTIFDNGDGTYSEVKADDR